MDKRAAKLWVVIKREYLERVRQRWFVITTLLVPFGMFALIAAPVYMMKKSGNATDVSRMVIVDATQTDLGERVALTLLDSTHAAGDAARAHLRRVTPAQLADAESTATRDVIARRVSGYLVLDSVTLRTHDARYEGRDGASLPTETVIARAVRTALIAQRLASSGIDARQVDSITAIRPSVAMRRLDEHGRGGSGQASFFVGFGMAMLLYVAIIAFGQNVLRGVMEEKQTRVAEVVVSSVSAETLLAGKVIGVAAVGLTQQIIWFFGSLLVLSQAAPIFSRLGSDKAAATGGAATASASALALPTFSPWLIIAVILFFVLGITFYCTLFAAVGAMVSSEQEAQQAALPVTMLAVLSFIFVQPITLAPSGTLALVMSYIPFSAPVVMPLRMTMLPLPWYEVAGSLLSVLAGCIVATWLAARIYRVGLLMTGKKPTLGELARWIRAS
ncbi:MAG: ABC transporter permease [Candidatus Eremiobacteraeota bacterium]|nr:ABC transporter permease [Candidatus Eremiobacteraeota bacterium]